MLFNTLIIIPAYNVEKRLRKLLIQLENYKRDVLFVDDGSNDKTYSILIENNYLVLHYSKNKGVSYAINKGIQYACRKGYNAVIIMDADCQHNPKYIPYFMSEIINNDFVIGNRFSNGYLVPDIKRNSNTFATCLVEIIFNHFIQDVSCGFKAFKLEKNIIEHIDYSTDYSIIFDLLICGITQNYKISIINMEPIYFPEELWYTRKIEISSFLKAVLPFAKEYTTLVETIFQRLESSGHFQLKLRNIDFYFHYLKEYDGYIIQADKQSIEDYHYIQERKNASKQI